MNVAHNRIIDYLGPKRPAPRLRTKAQRAAARLNGSRSTGPKTPEGKARSRLNALKHGLLARHIMPSSDPREHDRLYREARAGLIREFNPTTFSRQLLVDALAADVVSLTRASRMIEALQCPAAPPTPAHAGQWDGIVKARRECSLLGRCLKRLDAGEAACGSVTEADRVAATLAVWVKDAMEIVEDAAEIENDPTSPPQDKENLRLSRELLKNLGRSRGQFADAAYLSKLLSGDSKAVCVNRRLRLLLDHVYAVTKRRLRELTAGAHTLLKPYDDLLAAMARTPAGVEQLLLLDRYRASIEATVFRKLRQLGRE